MMEEGMMTLLRKNVVSNARLIKCADGRGLRVSLGYAIRCIALLLLVRFVGRVVCCARVCVWGGEGGGGQGFKVKRDFGGVHRAVRHDTIR